MKSIFVLLLVFAGFASQGLHAQTEDLPTIYQALADEPSTTTLLTALAAGDLTSNLEGEDKLILLAPTDDAFAALPEGLVEKLLQPGNLSTLRTLLAYHLVTGGEGDESASAAEKLGMAEATASSQIDCSNGTIYLIDQVLLPEGFDPAKLEE